MKFTETKLPLFAGVGTICVVLTFYAITLVLNSLVLVYNEHIAVVFLALALGAFVTTVIYFINKLMK